MFVCFLIFEFSDFSNPLSILFLCSFLKARIAEHTWIYTVDSTASILILSKAKQVLGTSLAVATRQLKTPSLLLVNSRFLSFPRG